MRGHCVAASTWLNYRLLENRIRLVALGRSNRVFAGSLRAGQRAAVVISLIQSAKLNRHDPHRYLKDVLERLPTQPARHLEDLLPHCPPQTSLRIGPTRKNNR
jgi:hypothetical protein